MLSLITSGTAALAVFLALDLTKTSKWGWALLFAILAFFAVNAVIGLLVNRRMKAIAGSIQGIMAQAQRQMQEKTQAWRFRPPGSIKQAQIEIGRMQHAAIEKALAATEAFEPLRKWSPLLKRQVATMRMQLNFQDRNWKAVDALLPKCLFLDPMTTSMAIARTYAREGYRHETDKKGRIVPNEIDKYFERGVARLRYGQGALLYGLLAWIQNSVGDIDGAFATLQRADKKMENACIKKNIETLRNNKPKQFSLAALGDEWYALGLEEPRMKMQRSRERPF